jgi:hypothetical protein
MSNKIEVYDSFYKVVLFDVSQNSLPSGGGDRKISACSAYSTIFAYIYSVTGDLRKCMGVFERPLDKKYSEKKHPFANEYANSKGWIKITEDFFAEPVITTFCDFGDKAYLTRRIGEKVNKGSVFSLLMNINGSCFCVFGNGKDVLGIFDPHGDEFQFEAVYRRAKEKCGDDRARAAYGLFQTVDELVGFCYRHYMFGNPAGINIYRIEPDMNFTETDSTDLDLRVPLFRERVSSIVTFNREEALALYDVLIRDRVISPEECYTSIVSDYTGNRPNQDDVKSDDEVKREVEDEEVDASTLGLGHEQESLYKDLVKQCGMDHETALATIREMISSS